MFKHRYSIVTASVFLALHGCGSVHRDGSDTSLDEANGGTGGRSAAAGDSGAPGKPDRNGDGPGGDGAKKPNAGFGCDITVPSVVLSTREGDQEGVSGSFCASNDEAGCGICADVGERPKPKQFTIVRSSDDATLRVIHGVISKPDNVACDPACPPQVRIVSLDCETPLDETRTLEDGDSWQLKLPTGKYQLTIDAYFIGDDGTYGQLDMTFGLIVDDSRDPAIVDASSEAAGSCGDDSGSAPLSCADRSKQALAFVQAALSQSTLECSADSDCMVVPTNTRCSSGCASLTNREGAAAVAKAIEEAELVCGPDGECPSEQIPCPAPPGGGFASCVSGACMSVPPTAWEAFSRDAAAFG